MLRTERIITILTLLLLGLGLVVAIDRGAVNVPGGEEAVADSLDLAVMALLTLGLMGLAAFGAEWVVRAHPLIATAGWAGGGAALHLHWRRFDLTLGPRVRLWVLPAALMLGAILFQHVFNEALVVVAILIVSGIGFAIAYYALYHGLDPADPNFGLATTVLNLLTHAAAFTLYVAIYGQKVRSLYSATAVTLVTVALLYEALARAASARAATATPGGHTTTAARHPLDHAHLLLYAAIAGLIIGEACWGLNYWAVGALVGGSFLLVLFYGAFGIISARLAGTLTRRVISEFVLVAAAGLIVIVASALIR
jgi:hypothetical protein